MEAESSRKSSAQVDRGWAWVVCIAGHFCIALTIGYATSLGVFFIEWKDQFELSATSSSWVVGMPLLVGSFGCLFMGDVALWLGIRRVSMLGSAVSGLASILASFSTNVWHLYLSGAMSGIGLMLVVSPSLVILSQYFRKRFALAVGLLVVGLSTGQSVFPLLFRLLIVNYGWRGAMMIGGAIQMNSVAACALFRPLRSSSSDKVKRVGRRLEGLDNKGAIDMDMGTTPSGTLRNTSQETQTPDQKRKTTNTEKDNLNELSERKLETKELDYTKSLDSIPIKAVVSDQQLNVKLHSQGSVQTQQEKHISPENEEPICDVSRQDVNINNLDHSPKENNGGRTFRDYFGFLDVFSNSLVMLIVLESCFFAIGLSTNATHLPARVKEAGWSEDQGALVLTIYAIVSIVTRATHGWFVDKNYIGAFKLLAIVLFGCAVVSCMNSVSDSYIFLIGYGVILGGFVGIAAPLTIFTAKSVARPSQAPSAMGLVLCALFLFSGTGSIIAGKIFDVTGNYVATFLTAGATFFAASILPFIVAVCKKRRQIE
ncbi:monocarboxylate transporter 13-like isoform X1 [Asterias rubens]|uniref:monocarboxylate transporter 13-like isoform X1 n=1 Tax=Asterias rubens TaxID=7604 RepID=UPI001454FE8B|nr:monocarboxylate transporter 13-like isoform X1 [Asterias rubens]